MARSIRKSPSGEPRKRIGPVKGLRSRQDGALPPSIALRGASERDFGPRIALRSFRSVISRLRLAVRSFRIVIFRLHIVARSFPFVISRLRMPSWLAPKAIHRCQTRSEAPGSRLTLQSRGSTASLSSASTPSTHSCIRVSESLRTKRRSDSCPSASSRTASERLRCTPR